MKILLAALTWLAVAASAWSQELKDRLISLGRDARSSTPEEMGAFIRREQERYAKIIRDANIKVEQ